jgi:hypothetical protein
MPRRGALAATAAVAVTGAAVALPAPLGAAPTVRVSAVSSCTPRLVYVRLADGSVRQVTHGIPGGAIASIGRSTADMFLLANIGASWAAVTGGGGQAMEVDAAGPRGETWRFRFHVRNGNPLADPTSYQVCIALTSDGLPFLSRLRQSPGAWRFAVKVTGGSLHGARGAVRVRVLK